MMQWMTYQISFLTPAFLGNADQSGQWRTPPFKALLRQWWRVVWAERHEFQIDVAAMRRDEGRLFGNAWLDGDFRKDFRKSAVRLRLNTWNVGRATGERWRFGHDDRASHASRGPDPRRTTRRGTGGNTAIRHPEVGREGRSIDPLLYLGYGPLVFRREGTVLKNNAAIQAGETAELSIAAPSAETDDLRAALALMNAYGTVGGRSRNGWGSLAVESLDDASAPDMGRADPPTGDGDADHRFVRPWRDALALDWPHAIGRDGAGPLVWQTAESYTDWKALMRDLAILKIGLRTMFVFPRTEPPHDRTQDRHWLSYPVTNHNFSAWNNLRLPNSLRFKVRPDPDAPKRLRGVIFHVPCRPPEEFRPGDHAHAIKNVWMKTHELLDELTQRPVGRSYMMISDDERRGRLRRSLDSLTLARIPE